MTPRKKNLLENFTNIHFQKELSYLFGDDSQVKINDIKYLTQKKNFLIDVTINVTDVEHSSESYPHGVEYYISESCKVIKFFGDSPIIISSIKLKE